MSKAEETHSLLSVNSGGRFVILVCSIVLCYLLSPVPVVFMLEVTGVRDYSGVESTFGTFYAPLGYFVERYDWVEAFYQWQMIKLYSIVLHK